MSNLIKKVEAFSDEHQLITKGATIVIGLSGGPDSMALLSLLSTLQSTYALTLIAAHLDHQWRPDSSKDDEFCKAQADQLGIPYISAQASEITLTPEKRQKASGSKEELGRFLRRAFFNEIARTTDGVIALAHHYQDQQETFFIRIIRGASIAGLAGMKPKQGQYIRPLLTCTKQELIAYLDSKNLPYLEDKTNIDQRYLRNRIRHTVLPALRACDARFDSSFKKSLKNIQDTDAYLERVTEETYEQIAQDSGISIQEFLAIDPFLHHRLLVYWFIKAKVPFTPTTALLSEVMRFLNNPAKEHQVHPSWRLVKEKTILTIQHTS